MALASLLCLHSLAMSGGVLDALESLDERDVSSAVAGYRYFGMESAALVVEAVVDNLTAIDHQGPPDAIDELERDADLRYGTAVPDDSAIYQAFEQRLRGSPEAFAPVLQTG